MLRNACLSFLFATALPVEAATVTYAGLPYRGRLDAHFIKAFKMERLTSKTWWGEWTRGSLLRTATPG